MLAKVYGSALHGVEAFLTTIEVSISRGLGYHITGLPDESIKESLSRIGIALQQNGFDMPRTKLLIHLSPTYVRKSGSAYDLPIALGILLASGQIDDIGKLSRYIIAGELGLDGSVQPVCGTLCMSELASKKGFAGVVVPSGNATEAALICKTAVYPVQHLKQLLDFIRDDFTITPYSADALRMTPIDSYDFDFKNVHGQHRLKRACEIAAAGGHHLLMQGSPGTGKSLAAKCLPSILPPMNDEEILETTRIYSIANEQRNIGRLMHQRPFRMIHSTISEAALVGGGTFATPGEITKAHNGVLFMDEFSEFKTSLLEALRQPLEDRTMTVSRNKAVITYPANFLLVAAMNPCCCGYHLHPVRKCRCSKRALFWYRRKISGPLIDRFDIQVHADTSVTVSLFSPYRENETSSAIRQRVTVARQRQSERFQHQAGIHCNALMPHKEIRKHCAIDPFSARLLLKKLEAGELSLRGIDKTLKVARTIADLSSSAILELHHVAEALSYHLLDAPVLSSPISPKIKRENKHQLNGHVNAII